MYLVLVRGLPGSGKTTFGKTLEALGYKHFEADQYFEKGGVYAFDASKLAEAHHKCLVNTIHAMMSGHDVVVCNTFSTNTEMGPYLISARNQGAEVVVVEMTEKHESIHGVPQDVIEKMAARWEPFKRG